MRTPPPSDELGEERLVRTLERIARDLERVLAGVLGAVVILALLLILKVLEAAGVT